MSEPTLEYGRLVAASGLAGLLLLLGLETVLPLRRRRAGRPGRYVTNLCVTALALAVGAAVVTPAALRASRWATECRLGLINLLPLPAGARFAAGFLLMDATFYYWHRLNHVSPLLWRFHAVHHIDPDLDVTTSFRFHFGETLYSTIFRIVQVGFIGASPSLFIYYGLVFQLATLFHHSNLKLPLRIERALNLFFVTPRMHGIHHSWVQRETNSNYSVVFRWWDLINRSLRLNVKQSAITIGVPAFSRKTDNAVLGLLALPFRGRRDYWRLPDGRRPLREKSGGNPHLIEE